MISLTELLASRQKIKEGTPTYSGSNLRKKARMYSIVCDYFSSRFTQHAYKIFIKYPKQDCVVIDFQSINNSLLASMSLNKMGIISHIKPQLINESLINENTQLVLNLKLG